ncbi:MAG: NAD(P)-dependent oxidoreductase [Pseudomonadota bacterium]
MSILVTGATGFLGAHLAVSLRADGVIATGRNPEKLARLADMGLAMRALDLSCPIPSEGFAEIDAIVHCAGLSSPWGRKADFIAANVDATRNLIALARAVGAKRLIHISTASVYFQFRDQDGLGEADLPSRFVNAYAETKRAAEKLVLAATDLQPIVLRPRGIYGAGDTSLLPRLLRVARTRPIPRFSPAGATDITHVDDVVAACHAALRAPVGATGQIFNISGGVGIPLPEIIAAACERTGTPCRWRNLPFPVALGTVKAIEAVAARLPGNLEPPVTAYALGILRYRQTMSLTGAKTDLGWQPRIGFDEGLARTFEGGTIRKGPV